MYPKTIVILMTAYAINDMVREALQEGAYACLEKPLEMDEIIKMIKTITG
jgi:DNA-binding NtrC family response regulator